MDMSNIQKVADFVANAPADWEYIGEDTFECRSRNLRLRGYHVPCSSTHYIDIQVGELPWRCFSYSGLMFWTPDSKAHRRLRRTLEDIQQKHYEAERKQADAVLDAALRATATQ